MSTVTKQMHTEGPWQSNLCGEVVAEDGNVIVCALIARGKMRENAEADARVISAAPEMLAALELILSEMREGQYSPSLGAMQQVYAAVCKAKGE